MLDWRDITDQIHHAETLSLDDLKHELAALRESSPDVGNIVTQYFSRKRNSETFMRTSAGQQPGAPQILANGTLLGVWKIIDHLGSGGMGDVYKAERNDGLYDQLVALKVIQRRDSDSLSRFEAERKRLADLEHPGVSRIIDGGETETGYPFMVMEYVEGQSIENYIQDRELTRPEILKLFIQLCESVTHAHSKLILHRDIKTNNVLVDAAGSVKLIDFGIASIIGDTPEGYGGPMTIAYAAPEQLMGKSPDVGSDVFALGVLLHVMLTGEPPQRQADGSVKTDADAIRNEDLAAIISKATSFEEGARYQSVTAFSDDVQAYLETRPVIARNGKGFYRFKKLVLRNALASSLAAAFVLALSGGLIGSLVMADKAAVEAQRANSEAVRANSELDRAEWNLRVAAVRATISSSQADSFQYVFGLDSDDEKLSKQLIKYLDGITEAEIANNPEMSAGKVYVVGKHFLSRNDYVTARDVFEPWLKESHGDPQLRAFGYSGLGFAYQQLGETKLALEMFQNAENYFLGTPLENTIEHAAAAIQIGLLSTDAEETKRALKIIHSVLDTDKGPYNQSYLIGRIYKIERKHKNWDAAYAALERQIEMIETGHLGQISSADTSHVNFAKLNFFYTQNYALSMRHIKIAQDIGEKKKGKSGTLGSVYQILALHDWVNKDFEDAEEKILQSLPLLKKYSGTAGNYVEALAMAGIIQIDDGASDAALNNLRILKTDLSKKANNWPDLLELYIVTRQNGLEAGQDFYDSEDFKREEMGDNLHQSYFLKTLERDGLNL